MGDDSDGKDTQVLPRKDTPFDMEGTEEMDRSVLLARLQADQPRKGSEPQSVPSARDTIQHTAVSEATRPTEPVGVVGTRFDPTQHYVVPDSLIEQSRDDSHGAEDDDLPTTTFSMETLLEFDAVVDQEGRIALPRSALNGRFGRGAKIRVVAHVIEDE